MVKATDARFWLWYGLPAVLAVIVAGCGGQSPGGPPPSPDPCVVDPAGCAPPPPPGGDCGPGLAAQDLSGTCRAKPQATMGALEAV